MATYKALEGTNGTYQVTLRDLGGKVLRLFEVSGGEPQVWTEKQDWVVRGGALLATFAGSKGPVVNRRNSGEHCHAEQTITPMRDRSSSEITHLVSVLRDMAERNALRQREVELRLTSSVRRRLFRQESPAVPGYDIAGAVVPASTTCGD